MKNLVTKSLIVMTVVLATDKATPRRAAADDQANNPAGRAAGATAAGERIALLVGVAKYAHLSEAEQLAGCTNDVDAMAEVLTSRFGFEPANILRLTNEQATGQAIRGAFRELARRVSALPAARRPAQVLFHFSGHGSQIPDQPTGPDHDEDDGLDETLVPFDAVRQGGAQDIRDDEINAFVDELCAGGRANMLVVFDCCHSGTGARGATRTRKLDRRLQRTNSTSPLNRKSLPAGAVFLSACRDREVEPEFQDGDRTYGLLTRFLVEVLNDERQVSRLSYDLLRRSIVSRYLRDRRVIQAPTPQIEGRPDTLRATVLGFGNTVDRPPYYDATASGRSVEIKAGSFHHVTVGSLFELYRSPEEVAVETADPIAWLRVTRVDATTSKAEPVERPNDDRSPVTPAQLPSGFSRGFAVERVHHPGDVGLKIKVAQIKDGVEQFVRPADVARKLGLGLDELPWLRWCRDDSESSDLVMRIDGRKAALFPASGFPELPPATGDTDTGDTVATPLRGGWGPIDLNQPKRELVDHLRRIVRARNLLSLAAVGPGLQTGFDVSLELLEVDYDFDNDEVKRIRLHRPDAEHQLRIPSGAVYAFRITNRDARRAVYVTVLSVSPNMGIEVVMPYLEPAVKLEPGESRDSDPFECEPPFGIGRAIVLVTREPADFSFVAQPDLPQTRGQPPAGGAGWLTERLIEETYFRTPATRGRRLQRKKSTDAAWYADVLSVRFVPPQDRDR